MTLWKGVGIGLKEAIYEQLTAIKKIVYRILIRKG